MKLSLMKSCALGALIISSTACQSSVKPEVAPAVLSCSSISSIALDVAVNDAKQQLNTGLCSAHFADYYSSLLNAAKGDPKTDNKRVFNDFLSWSQKHNIITKVDAISYFTQYFGERFVSLNSTYNTCSQSTQQSKIFAALDREMAMKKIGILEVLDDKPTFNTIASQKQDLETVLEATWMACDAS